MLKANHVCPIRLPLIVCVWSLLLCLGCSKKQEAAPAQSESTAQPTAPVQTVPASAVTSEDEPPAPSNSMQLPLNFNKHTGDLDEMVKRKNIRALVMINPVAFFYDQGQ